LVASRTDSGTEPAGAIRDEAAHPVRIGLGVLAQRPPDRLAQEELSLAGGPIDGQRKQGGVGVGLSADLANDRGPA